MRRLAASAFRQTVPSRTARAATRHLASARRVWPAKHSSRRCACGGGCPRCQVAGTRDFAGVRFHPSAPEVTTPLRARAVTIGQDVYFHPGHFRPGTREGERLIAHELAHTLQTRRGAGPPSRMVSWPGDALERNADALARGETSQVLGAPAGAALRTPFDSERPEDRARRQSLLTSIAEAEAHLVRLMQTGGIMTGDEVVTERGGVRGVIVPAATSGRSDENFVSFADRDTMLRRILRTLMAMGTYYHSHPIPATLPPAALDPPASPTSPPTYSTAIVTPTGGSSFGGGSIAWSQLQAAYELYLVDQGVSILDNWVDYVYIEPGSRIEPGAARGAPRLGRGVASGAYMVVPDIENEPLRYWRLDGFTPIPAGSIIVEFWHDDLGYYYMRRGQRIDVPSPWSH